MNETKVVITKNKYGNRFVEVINDDLSQREKTLIKYEVYKNINESYQKLLQHLPEEDHK
jgi:RNA-binding protein YhbY